MNIERDIFLKYNPNIEKLKEYGFVKKNHSLYFEKLFANDEFKAIIKITKDGEILGSVYDIENNDEFLPLRIENNEGSFAGKIRNEYIEILIDIRDKCFYKLQFISEQGNRISELIKKIYGDSPLFMWEEYPNFGVFKNPQSNKWYGIIMYVSRTKLGEPSENGVEILNLKIDKDKILELVKQDGIYPAYHMNKKYWITLTLDDTISDEEIMKYIEESHSFTIKKSERKKNNSKRIES